jgi:thiol-disulfide isomerase/thioredoxin
MTRLGASISRYRVFLIALAAFVVVAVSITAWIIRPPAPVSPLSEQLLSVPTGSEPAFVDRRGNPVDPATLVTGEQIVIVNSWASWSPYAARELPLLSQVAVERGSAVRILAVNRDEPDTRMEAYLSTLGELPGIDFILDQNDYYYQQIGGFAMPETIFYDRDGNIFLHKRGELTKAEVDDYLNQLLATDNN